MNDKELREIRRRFRHNKSNITSIKGCIVDKDKTIKAYINQSLINSVSEDCDKLLCTIKKTLSGSVGTNLYDLEYSAMQVMESAEHALLCELNNSGLNNEEALSAFYNRIIESVISETAYAILIASDNYDVFNYTADGEKEEDSSSVFSYFVCCICPIKEAKPFLYYNDFDKTFRITDNHHLIGNPDFGFMFPTFDDRASNIYKVQFYSKDVNNIHADFIRNIFNLDCPKPSAEQKESFGTCLTEALEEDCDLNLLKSVHEHVTELVSEHKINKEEEPLTLTKQSFRNVLESSGVSSERVEEFETKFEKEFGENAQVPPSSIIDTKKFEVNTPYVSIKVDPERSDLISTQVIDGSRYILIRANDNVEVNGVNIDLK